MIRPRFPRFALAWLIFVGLGPSACAATLAAQHDELTSELEQLRASITAAVEHGGRAPGCAPKALAYAEANLDFAEQTLADEQFERAAAHIDEGQRWIAQANETIAATPAACVP